ncbi:MAG: hypothetical protein GX072_03740 [Lysinibacillus sp.]|jgi:hypothetical protein|nr:hypothetical protein [Lysinibacillus sp.]
MINNKKIDYLIHLPDLQFVKYCEDVFRINRGVYNIIDAWFYEKSITNIASRRKIIIEFLTFLNKDCQKIKFGPGGVKNNLKNFWNTLKDSQVG